jgi:hypothetical protein
MISGDLRQTPADDVSGSDESDDCPRSRRIEVICDGSGDQCCDD